MKKLFLILFLIIPNFTFADIAWPVLTKEQACLEKDGASMNRLQVVISGKKWDTLYFFKQKNILYYIVPMFPYIQKDQYGSNNRYSAWLFLYQYNCIKKKSEILLHQNLKNYIDTKKTHTPWSDITLDDIKTFNFGRVLSASDIEIFFELGITQTGVGESFSFTRKTKSVHNSIYLGNDWSVNNSSDSLFQKWDIAGMDIMYQWKQMYHFASCKWFGTKKQTDWDDFCGSTIEDIATNSFGLYFTLSYNYPWAPLEPGRYTLSLDGKISKIHK